MNHLETWHCTICGKTVTEPDTPNAHDLREHTEARSMFDDGVRPGAFGTCDLAHPDPPCPDEHCWSRRITVEPDPLVPGRTVVTINVNLPPLSRIVPAVLSSQLDLFWTADGWVHRGATGFMVPCEEAIGWYIDERNAHRWIDIGGSE